MAQILPAKTRIVNSLNAMDSQDIYSMLLFVLYKMRDMPEFLALSEISYLIDGSSLLKVLRYYGGMTIRIPTLEEFRMLVKAMQIYQLVDIEGEEFKNALYTVATPEFTAEDLKFAYLKISEVLSNYEFNNHESVQV